MRNEGVARVLFQERELAAGCNGSGVYVFTSKGDTWTPHLAKTARNNCRGTGMSDGLLDTPETELLIRLQRADPQAWKEIVRRYGPPLRREVSRLIKDEAEAEDVTQEVFLRMYQAINDFEGETNLLGWAWQVAKNAALNDIRDRGNRERLLGEKLPAGEPTLIDPEKAADARETMNRVQTAVAELPERDRELLAKAADLNIEEPARGARSPTERSRLSRIRQWLRERILGGEKGR